MKDISLNVLAALALSGAATAAVDFNTDVAPILSAHCLKCHRADNDKGDYRLDNESAAFAGDLIKPGDPDGSVFIELIELPDDDDDVMPPPKEKRMTPEEKKILRDWVAEGADWPDGQTLKMPAPVVFKRDIKPILDKLTAEEREKLKLWIKLGAEWPDEAASLELVKRLHAKIVETSAGATADTMANYGAEIPSTGAPFSMVAIPGGSFTMGSPDSETGRKDHEGPQREIKVAPFWIGKHEVTWDEYEPFMIDGGRRNKDGSKMFVDPGDTDVDLVSRPTKPYVEMTFGMGKEGYPAISMTQHAALSYCKWLSAQTGHFYRLPTEAEWEYACRAGTAGPFSFGDKEVDLHQYGWFIDNADFTYQQVGKKKPNPWGLHDMHGNVAEWTMDILAPYDTSALDNPWARGRELYPRAVRGGSWNDFPDALRSAARLGSSKTWKQQDPQLPKSIWYHTDAQWLGFRIVRPLEVPTPEEMDAIWKAGVDHDTLE